MNSNLVQRKNKNIGYDYYFFFFFARVDWTKFDGMKIGRNILMTFSNYFMGSTLFMKMKYLTCEYAKEE
jgi:hypothetical protein